MLQWGKLRVRERRGGRDATVRVREGETRGEGACKRRRGEGGGRRAREGGVRGM